MCNCNILKWAQEKGMDLVSDYLCNDAAENGHVHVLDWIHERHLFPANKILFGCGPVSAAARGGRIPVLQWLQENGVLPLND